MPSKKVWVLIIDDESGSATKRHLERFVTPIVRHPNDVQDVDLKRANVVLIDFKLEQWNERDNQTTPSLKPQNGIALAAVLRSNQKRLGAAPTAFALNSGLLDQLGGGVSSEGREYAIARSIDLEWVFQKDHPPEAFAISVTSLARAVAAIPKKWPGPLQSRALLTSLLEVPSKVRWRDSAMQAIERSYPPHDILAKNSHGIAVLRWLLHNILPFPSFLLDTRYLAARLSIDPASFRDTLQSAEGKKIRKKLNASQYTGVLADFSGSRWWRAGIEYWIWEHTRGQPFDREALAKIVRDKFSKKVKIAGQSSPVVSLDDHFRPTDILIEHSLAVEIQPDGWPPYADPAWVSIEKARVSPALNASVSEADKSRLGD